MYTSSLCLDHLNGHQWQLVLPLVAVGLRGCDRHELYQLCHQGCVIGQVVQQLSVVGFELCNEIGV